MVIARSILFNILFYLNLVVLLILAIPTLLLPSQAILIAVVTGFTSRHTVNQTLRTVE